MRIVACLIMNSFMVKYGYITTNNKLIKTSRSLSLMVNYQIESTSLFKWYDPTNGCHGFKVVITNGSMSISYIYLYVISS